MTSRKKLIEHSLPLDAINAASSREKSVRHGHPSTLHLWWARRPLAACRAVIFAQLVDDPESWPELFPDEETQDRERRRLHRIIEEMVEWPKTAKKDQDRFSRAIEAARFEIARSVARELGINVPHEGDAIEVLEFLQEHGPPVYDPFCGGGSIPLEAQRLGLRAYGSDLNPVAALITKALIEFPPKFAGLPPVHPDVLKDTDLAGREWKGAEGLAEDVRRYGAWIRNQAEHLVGQNYPAAALPDGNEATVIAWLWARTVASPDPALQGAHVPLASSFLLSSKKGQEAIVLPIRDEKAPDGWRFEVKNKGVTAAELAAAKEGTIGRSSGGTCILSGSNMPFSYVREQGKSSGLGARLMAVVAESRNGRVYLSPTREHEAAAEVEKPHIPELQVDLPHNPRDFKTPNYGLTTWSDLFTARQLNSLSVFSELVLQAREEVLNQCANSNQLIGRKDDRPLCDGGTGAEAYADAIATYLGFCIGKATDYWSSICGWHSSRELIRNTFGRQAIPMVWDYAETNPISNSAGNWNSHLDWIAKALASVPAVGCASVTLLDAPKNNYPVRPVAISTDPPYYDNIGYADLSDFFYVWHRKTLRSIHPELYRRLATEKQQELVATPYRFGGKEAAEEHFMSGMGDAMSAMRDASAESPLTIYYAFKQSEIAQDGVLSPGWASFLQAVVNAGLIVDGTWPIRTELANRMIASGANALASSVVLVCRKRADEAPAISRRDFQRELRIEMEEALQDQQASIPLPDRRQAAIGPGIGVFSKYRCVREADDSEMTVATALTLINREIDAILSAGTEALDAETRFALEWYSRHGFSEGRSGDAISALQGFNLSEAAMNRSGLFRARSGTAKLLTREEMNSDNPDWSPASDDTPTAWEMAQHLARIHGAQDGGIEAAGRILAQRSDAGPDVLLVAERLYDMDNNRGRAAEALVWNELQADWPQILAAADRAREEGYASPAQGEMNV